MLLFAASCAALNLLMGFTGRSTRTRAPAMKQLTFFTGAHLSLCLHAHELASHPKQEYGFTLAPSGSLQVLSSVAFAPRTIKGTNDNKYMAAPPSATRHTQKRAAAQTLSVRCDLRWRWGCNTSHTLAVQQHDIYLAGMQSNHQDGAKLALDQTYKTCNPSVPIGTWGADPRISQLCLPGNWVVLCLPAHVYMCIQ